MKVVEPKITDTENFKSSDSINGYYLVSIKWTEMDDEYITFVRKSTVAYCYNMDWAGPKNICELEEVVRTGQTLIVHQSTIDPFLVHVNHEGKECTMLPNTFEVRRAIGFEEANLQLVV